MVHKMGGSVTNEVLSGEEDDGDTDLRGVADLDWNVLGRIASKYTRRAPAMDFILGPLALVPKTRKQTKRQKTNNALAKGRSGPRNERRGFTPRGESDHFERRSDIADSRAMWSNESICIHHKPAFLFPNRRKSVLHVISHSGGQSPLRRR